jgi:hypothetical protein
VSLRRKNEATRKLPVVWTDHAVTRAYERFGFDPSIKIPNGSIRLKASKTEIGESFQVRYDRVCYVCCRLEEKILIVTVYENQDGLKKVTRYLGDDDEVVGYVTSRRFEDHEN